MTVQVRERMASMARLRDQTMQNLYGDSMVVSRIERAVQPLDL
jgi:hypothetical protein